MKIAKIRRQDKANKPSGLSGASKNPHPKSELETFASAMSRRNRELAATNRTLMLLRSIDSLVLEPNISIETVCVRITQAIANSSKDYAFVGLLTRSAHSPEELILTGASSQRELDPRLGFSRPLHVKLTNPWFSNFAKTRLVDLEELGDEDMAAILGCSEREVRHIRSLLPLRSVYVVKLLARQQVSGLLVVGFDAPLSSFKEVDVATLDQLSDSIGVALDNKLLFEENRKVLKQIKESNSKLLALDEAKDDFISMASHQLRTPLTSVKGYLSMVLEGDAGEITPQQKKLLSQAFSSSQRMVYIIADLLNVSRLRTGKFVMESMPVNLADLVEQEVEQLKDTAELHVLKLTYTKPEGFPELMLDETNTRQVIMNFIDNAIYYTPEHGHIKVRLIDKPTTVELRVEDNGMGVPRSEQAHLFTKFYRAANARKSRPDGTGLGLFMAKKVVIAQHGSIIFESKEGKGSTFGFALDKTKLAVPAQPAPGNV